LPRFVQRTCWASTVGRAPWGVAFPAGKGCVHFHYVRRGNAWLSVDKTDGPRVALSGGDLVVMPHGHAHALRDHARSKLRRWDELARCVTQTVPGVLRIDIGTTGPETTLITGAFVLDDPLAAPLLAALPPLIRLTPDTEQAVPSFLENLQFIAREVDTNRPGAEIVLLRMADVLFIQILRAYLARLRPTTGVASSARSATRAPPRRSAPCTVAPRRSGPWRRSPRRSASHVRSSRRASRSSSASHR
jgi:hypothetical protein